MGRLALGSSLRIGLFAHRPPFSARSSLARRHLAAAGGSGGATSFLPAGRVPSSSGFCAPETGAEVG